MLSLTDPDNLRQSKFTDDEIEIIKNLALEKLQKQRIVQEHVAMDLLEKQSIGCIVNRKIFFCLKNELS